MSTISVLDSTGTTQALQAPLIPGRAAATSSRPVALSNEDFTPLSLIGGSCALLAATAPANAQLIGGIDLNGKLQGLGLSVFHNADNQTLNATAQGLITGGVTQIINSSGNLDRIREGYADGMAVTGFAGNISMTFNGTTFDRSKSAYGDALTAVGISAASDVIYNGTTFDRPRSAYSDALAITGIPAEAEMLWNGTAFDRARSVSGDAMAAIGLASEIDMLWNGTTYDRPRSAPAAQATTGVGIAADAAFGIYNTTAPTLANAQYSAVQVDVQGNLKQSCATGFLDSTTVLAANGTFTGTARGTSQAYTYFAAMGYADQAGTLYIDVSFDTGTTWQVIATQAMTALTTASLKTPVYGAGVSTVQYRVRVLNGATLQTILRVASSFIVA
jgi:hypothetical protein